MEISSLLIYLFPLVALAVLLAEVAKRAAAYRWLRLLCLVLALASLYLLFLPQNSEPTRPRTLHILTQGAENMALERGAEGEWIALDSSLSTAHAKTQYIDNLPYYLYKQSKYSEIHVYGYGLNAQERQAVKGLPFHYHSAPAPAGVQHIAWKRYLSFQERLQVQGFLLWEGEQPLRLVLTRLGETLQEQLFSEKGTHVFRFSSPAGQVGRVEYELLSISGTDTLERSPLPVHVEPFRPLRISLFASSADVERKFLKSHLAANGHELQARTRISKERFAYEQFNRQAGDSLSPSAALFSRTDLLLVDERELAGWPAAQIDALQQATFEGMGLLIWADSANSGTLRNLNIRLQGKPLRTGKGDSLLFSESGLQIPFSGRLDQRHIQRSAQLRPLLETPEGALLAGWRSWGLGRVGISSFSSGFMLQLQGKEEEYAALWSELLSLLARDAEHAGNWRIRPALPRRFEKADLQLESQAPPGEVSWNGGRLAPGQDPLLLSRWHYNFWPQQPGWNQLSLDGDSLAVFVFSEQDWPAIRIRERMAQNRALQMKKEGISSGPQVEKPYRRPLAKGLFFAVFLLACSILWIIERRGKRREKAA